MQPTKVLKQENENTDCFIDQPFHNMIKTFSSAGQAHRKVTIVNENVKSMAASLPMIATIHLGGPEHKK